MKSKMTYLIAILSLFGTSVVFAQQKGGKKQPAFERPYGLAGCGFGSVIIPKKGSQIFASTTNSTSYSNLFGISSGTLNCVDGPNVEVASKMDQFILSNRLALSADVARGEGNTLAGLAQVMGCQSQAAQVGKSLKGNFETVFQDGNAPANEVTDAIISTILEDQSLSKQCNLG